MNRDLKVPYDSSGNLLHTPDGDEEWKDNVPFRATLTLVGTVRGRSAAYFLWEDSQGHRYPMFMADVAKLLRVGSTSNCKTTAIWYVIKRGYNYGISILSEEEQTNE